MAETDPELGFTRRSAALTVVPDAKQTRITVNAVWTNFKRYPFRGDEGFVETIWADKPRARRGAVLPSRKGWCVFEH